jgi:hypothetical protein
MLSRAVRRVALLSGQTPSMMGRVAAVVAPASVAPRAPRLAFGSVAASDARVDAEHRHQQIQAAINKAARQLEDAHADVARLKAAKGSADEIQRALASVDSARSVSRSTIKQHITAGHAALVELVMNACVETNTPFKRDPMTWGVTRDDDPRMTPRRFGDYKSPQRLETEAKLREYMSAPSRSRQTGLRDFSIAVTVAAPGTGKTRLLDDALRMPLDTKHFAHVLRLAITFNGMTGGVLAHPLAARVLREFFCGPADIVADDVLKKIDAQLSRLFPNDDVDTVARSVLDALEALYFQQRGDGTLGRSVLLIDEIAKALLLIDDKGELCEDLMYRIVVSWIDKTTGRRGAVFTALTIESPWADASSAGRPLVGLPLGTFDVWDAAVQRAIEDRARSIGQGFGANRDRMWSLLAATGGRPRDVFLVLERLKDLRVDLTNAEDEVLLSALRVDDADSTFSRYLLPSMLGVQFDTFLSDRPTQFGNDAASSALLNADVLATKQCDVPTVSLRHSRSFPASADHLRHVFAALVKATVFCKLDGTGTYFKRAWALLTYSMLHLQHTARKDEVFWPTLGGPRRPGAPDSARDRRLRRQRPHGGALRLSIKAACLRGARLVDSPQDAAPQADAGAVEERLDDDGRGGREGAKRLADDARRRVAPVDGGLLLGRGQRRDRLHAAGGRGGRHRRQRAAHLRVPEQDAEHRERGASQGRGDGAQAPGEAERAVWRVARLDARFAPRRHPKRAPGDAVHRGAQLRQGRSQSARRSVQRRAV